MPWNAPDDPRASLRWSLTKLRRALNEDGDEPRVRTDGSSVFLDTNKLDVDLLHVAHIYNKKRALSYHLRLGNLGRAVPRPLPRRS
jgi:DNA-binding SARP family transcriptional activator